MYKFFFTFHKGFAVPMNQRMLLSCLLRCSARWSDLEKALSHILHWKGRSPVCLRMCRVSSSERANFQPHSFHVQTYGFSPVWVRRCAFKWLDLV